MNTFTNQSKFLNQVWKLKTISVLITISAFYCSCKKDKMPLDNSYNNQWGAPSLTHASVRYNIDTIAELKAQFLQSDTATVTFLAGTKSKSLYVGDILAAGINPQSPDGLLRKIISISQSNGMIICKTAYIDVADVIPNVTLTRWVNVQTLLGSVSQLGNTNTTQKTISSNFATATAGETITLPFTHDFGPVVVDTKLAISGNFKITLEISSGKISKFQVDLITTQSAVITATNNKAYSGALYYDFPSIDLPPLQFDIGIPLVLKPRLRVTIGVNGQLTEKITASATNVSSQDIGVLYQSGTWTPILTNTHKIISQLPKFSGKAQITPYIKVTLNLVPFGIPNFLVAGALNLTTKASVPILVSVKNSDVTVKADLDLDSEADADLRLFDLYNLNYSHNFPSLDYNFYNASYSIAPMSTSGTSGSNSSSNPSGTSAGGSTSGKQPSSGQTGSSSSGSSSTGSGGQPSSTTGTNGNAGTSTTSPGNGSGASAIPAIGTYTNPVPQHSNMYCPVYTDGQISARVVAVDEKNHQITFEIKRSDNNAFQYGGTIYINSGLCNGATLGSTDFPATVYTHQVVLTDSNMPTNPNVSKVYSIFIQQSIGGKLFFYDSPDILVKF